MINIGKDIKIHISDFKSKKYVHIRKWFEKDGELRPGKGISMSVDEWDEFSNRFTEIQEYIKENK